MVWRIGLVGALSIARAAVIAPARNNPDFEVTAVAARDHARAKAYAEQHGIAQVAGSYAELVVRNDVDVVYNALQPAAHMEWTLAALEAGKAVLCEKPFAMDAGEARAMVDAAAERDLVLLEAFHYRLHRVMHEAVALVRSGALGRLIRASAHAKTYTRRSPDSFYWRRELGGGSLMHLGCYPLHALRSLVGAEPQIVSARATFEDGVDMELSSNLRFPGGVEAEIACAQMASGYSAPVVIEGDRGRLEIDNFIVPQLGGARFSTTIDGVTKTRATDGPTTYEAQLAHLADVLRGGSWLLIGGADAVANMTAIDAIYRAAGRAAD